MSFVQQRAPTLLAPGVQVRMACATMVAGPTWFTVEPIRKVMFALLGERASAGAAMAAHANTTGIVPLGSAPVIAERLLDLLHPSQPAFSPDGARVAFSVQEAFSRPDEGVSSRIWIAQADGSGARQATRGPRADTSPRWSPDGGSLAFLSERDHA